MNRLCTALLCTSAAFLALLGDVGGGSQPAPHPCNGHNGYNTNNILLAGEAIKTQVTANEKAIAPSSGPSDLGSLCVGVSLKFHVAASDTDALDCKTVEKNVANNIANSDDLKVRIIEPGSGRQLALVSLVSEQGDTPATMRTWTNAWTLPPGAAGKDLLIRFSGSISDVQCNAPKHAVSSDILVQLEEGPHIGQVKIYPLLHRTKAFQNSQLRGDSKVNNAPPRTGYACAGTVTLEAYSDEDGEEQEFPDGQPVWTVQKMPAAAGGGGGGPPSQPGPPVQIGSGKTVEHTFDEPGLYKIQAANCASEATMFLTEVKVDITKPTGTPVSFPKQRHSMRLLSVVPRRAC